MDGAIAHGGLSASTAHPSLLFRVATPADDAALRALLRESPMRGAISLSFEREPDYFGGSGLGGAADTTIVAVEWGRLVALGRCTVRDCWLGGEIRRVGYLAELRVAAAARGRWDLLRGGYRLLRELQAQFGADFYFTSIAADNERARRLLERGLAGLPRYELLCDFVTLLIPVSNARPRRRLPLEGAPVGEIAAFLNGVARAHHLATAWTEPTLRALGRHGLSPEDFRVLRHDGEMVACIALWDQRPFRQTRVRGYSPALALARPAFNFARGLIGAPRLPAPGSILPHAFLFPLAVAPGHEALLPDLVATLFAAPGRGLDLVTLGFPAGSPMLDALRRRFRCRAYASRLYHVAWPDERPGLTLDRRPFLPEVALL